jgi:hypothetical protein
VVRERLTSVVDGIRTELRKVNIGYTASASRAMRSS